MLFQKTFGEGEVSLKKKCRLVCSIMFSKASKSPANLVPCYALTLATNTRLLRFFFFLFPFFHYTPFPPFLLLLLVFPIILSYQFGIIFIYSPSKFSVKATSGNTPQTRCISSIDEARRYCSTKTFLMRH